MATDFKILRGPSETLTKETLENAGKLVNGYWYLTNDTAEVYVCLEIDGQLTLKKINECDVPTDFPDMESFEDRLAALEAERTHVFAYRRLFPETGERDHMYVATDEKRTYVFHSTHGYLQVADYVDTIDHDSNTDTPEVRILYGGDSSI